MFSQDFHHSLSLSRDGGHEDDSSVFGSLDSRVDGDDEDEEDDNVEDAEDGQPAVLGVRLGACTSQRFV